MSAFEFQIAPAVFLVWLLGVPCLVVATTRSVGSVGSVVRVLIYNAIVLTIFCGLWYLGYYLSEHWMHIIDLGAPWSWLVALLAASFAVSLWALRKQPKPTAKSLVGPAITAPAFWLWVLYCAIKFDPFW
jgi:hypothetical protein